jgi:hypothetical protein
MSLSASECLHSKPLIGLSQAQLTSLARTCELAEAAITVHDGDGQCLYANRHASKLDTAAGDSFEIINDQGNVMGVLKTSAA